MAWRDSFQSQRVDEPSVVAIGTFDGVHLGHQHLVQRVSQRAVALGGQAVVVTFHPRPAEILRPDKPSSYLCSLEERIQRLRVAGADRVIVMPFSSELADVSAEEFVGALVANLGMRRLVGGPDLALGRGREGTIPVLEEIGTRLGFTVEIVKGLEVSGQVVRTSAIRQALAEANLGRAQELLGRPYAVAGVVIRGDGRGRTIGIPTANVRTPVNLVLPANGVYAVRFRVDGQAWNGAANLGLRPTFAGVRRTLEVHLLDFTGDLYDRECVVEFVARLRPEQRFGGVDELVGQIRRDIDDTRRVLGTTPGDRNSGYDDDRRTLNR
jgi:riboflavin kinase/FMN adenylyltransferase